MFGSCQCDFFRNEDWSSGIVFVLRSLDFRFDYHQWSSLRETHHDPLFSIPSRCMRFFCIPRKIQVSFAFSSFHEGKSLELSMFLISIFFNEGDEYNSPPIAFVFCPLVRFSFLSIIIQISFGEEDA